MQVWQWLDVFEWNLASGELAVGANVTVNGEMAGEARSAASFWAKVISKTPLLAGTVDDQYVVEDASGVKHTVARSLLRHRVFVKQCHVGVTGDKKHDRFVMMSSPPCLLMLKLYDL